MIIAISGKSGCGNTTVSTLAAEILNLRLINFTFRTLAEERGVSFEEIRAQAERDPAIDRLVDERQRAEVAGGNAVLASRLAIWLIPQADLKVFLTAPVEVRARRIQVREQRDYEDVLAYTLNRDKRDHDRYLRLYDIDNDDFDDVADLIINTERFMPIEIANQIANMARNARLDR